MTDRSPNRLFLQGRLSCLTVKSLVVIDDGAAIETEALEEASQLIIMLFNKGADRVDPLLLAVLHELSQQPYADAAVLIVRVDKLQQPVDPGRN